MKRVLAAVCLLLVGCHASVGYRWGMPAGAPPPAAAVDLRVGGEVNSTLGAILMGILIADGIRYYWRLPDGSWQPHEVAPDPGPPRAVNVQDCTRPVDPAHGNLMCR